MRLERQVLTYETQPIAKRRAGLLRAMGRTSEAVNALSSLLDMSPTDAEAWAELADLYLAQGLYSQAIFAQEEVLILQPNAWNVRHMYPGTPYFSPKLTLVL